MERAVMPKLATLALMFVVGWVVIGTGDSTASTIIGCAVMGLGGIGLMSLIFYEIGKSEDRAREREDRARERERQ